MPVCGLTAFAARASAGTDMTKVGFRTRWRHQMETFSGLRALCAGNSPITGEFPSKRPVAYSLDVFVDLGLNKRLSNQPRGW